MGHTVSQAPKQSLHGLRILVVDDHHDSRELLAELLRDHHGEVSSAASAADALSQLSASRFDALVADIAMPDEDGLSLVRKMRANRSTRTIFAIAVSGHAYEGDRSRALSAGFQVFIAKPFTFDEVLNPLRQFAASFDDDLASGVRPKDRE
jgi:CheY-like chemotaxis protein